MSTLLTITPSGAIIQVRPSKGKGFDLAKVPQDKAGKLEIRRSSLVEWDAERRGWFIQFIDASKECTSEPDGILREIDRLQADAPETLFPGLHSFRGTKRPIMEILLWDEYEDAVKAEVFMLEHWRRTGKLSE